MGGKSGMLCSTRKSVNSTNYAQVHTTAVNEKVTYSVHQRTIINGLSCVLRRFQMLRYVSIPPCLIPKSNSTVMSRSQNIKLGVGLCIYEQTGEETGQVEDLPSFRPSNSTGTGKVRIPL